MRKFFGMLCAAALMSAAVLPVHAQEAAAPVAKVHKISLPSSTAKPKNYSKPADPKAAATCFTPAGACVFPGTAWQGTPCYCCWANGCANGTVG